MKLIKLQDKFILVSDEKIKIGDDYIAWEINYSTEPKKRWVVYNRVSGLNGTNQKKIIAENPDFSLLSEEDCKTIGFVDVEKEIKKFIAHRRDFLIIGLDPIDKFSFGMKKGFELGKTVQSLNNKNFSLEQVIKAIDMAQSQYWDIDNRGFSSNTEGDWSFKHTEEQIIQSLQQTSWDVEVNEFNQITKIL